MAHSYNGLFDNMITDASMTSAFIDASENKRDRDDVIRVLSNLDSEREKLRQLLISETINFTKHPVCTINEYSCQKERDIIKPYYRYEQVVHHLVVNQLKPIILRSLDLYSCGSIPGRGCHYGKYHMERWIKEYPKDQTLYVLKMDVRHFFENIDHDILKSMLRKKIRDKKFLRLCFKIIDHVEKGLPLGYYTSQWFANFYLSDFDHYIREVLGAERYMRYMDDMVVLSTSKEELHRILNGAKEYLKSNLNLDLKDNWQIFPMLHDMQDDGGRALDYMGFKFYRNHTTLRKSILKRARAKANRIDKKRREGKPVTFKDATSIVSRVGWLSSVDAYNYYLKYIKPKVIIRDMKHKVSKHQRKENRHDRLENSERFTSDKAPRSGYYLFHGYCVSKKECEAGERIARGWRNCCAVGV